MKKGMKESYVEDLAKSRRPRVMRWRPVRAQRSVGRGARGPGVEPRNVLVWDADALIDAEGNIVGRGIASGRRVPRGQRARARVRSFHAENREILWPPVAVMAGRAAQGRLRPYAEVHGHEKSDRLVSTCEAAEQRRVSGGGGGGGKRPG